MWLEAIIVTGFRSFRDRTEVKFDRGHTAIIGRLQFLLISLKVLTLLRN